MKIFYGKAVYGREEINASLDVLKNKSLTLIDGPSVKELENKVGFMVGHVVVELNRKAAHTGGQLYFIFF